MDISRHSINKIVTAGTLMYVAAAGYSTAKDWIDGARQNSKCRSIALGQNRLKKGKVQECAIYSEKDIIENPALRDVRLYFLQGDSEDTKPYVIILPGGAYLECDTGKVAMPCAAKFNAQGYSAFVLRYRIRRHSDDYGPLNDLASAVRYISGHAQEFNVCKNNYMIIGFSAGGNLAGLFGSKSLGYAKYGLPKPAALSLVYPWTNINAKIHPTGNIFTDGYNLLGRTLAVNVMLGFPLSNSNREGLCVHNRLDTEYPPCFVVQGGADFLVPKEKNSDILVQRLQDMKIPHEYTVFPNLTHGFGIGQDTEAEGWTKRSLAFWQKSIKPDPE